MARKEFLDYVWKQGVEPQLGYSFSLNHTLPYSVIAIQEMNLSTKWNPLFWACACLCINAGNYNADFSDDDDEEEEEEEVLEEEATTEENSEVKKKAAKKNYGKIAKAIAQLQLFGVEIGLPDINLAEEDFIPDIQDNKIIYSLKAVNVVSDDLMEEIIKNRPYKSLDDFLEKVKVTPAIGVGLIKSGCFEKLEPNKSRSELINYFLRKTFIETNKTPDKLTLTHLKKLFKLGAPLGEFTINARVIKFSEYLVKNSVYEDDKVLVISDHDCLKFFNEVFTEKLKINEDYGKWKDDENCIFIAKKPFNKIVKNEYIVPLIDYLNTEEGKKNYIETLARDFINENRQKYCQGNIAAWEMSTMCFYHEPHELIKVKKDQYDIVDFNSLPEDGLYDEYTGKRIISCIVGTVIESKNKKGIVTILTPTGAVDVRLYKDDYNRYYNVISVMEGGKKVVKDPSWFKRGTKLIVYGERRDDNFVARKKYLGKGEPARMVGLIERVNSDGTLEIRYDKHKVQNEGE